MKYNKYRCFYYMKKYFFYKKWLVLESVNEHFFVVFFVMNKDIESIRA